VTYLYIIRGGITMKISGYAVAVVQQLIARIIPVCPPGAVGCSAVELVAEGKLPVFKHVKLV